MDTQTVVFTIFLIFTGAAIFSTVSLFTRQSLLIAYVLLGIALGPWGLKLVPDFKLTEQIGEIGIIFLLFLLGLHLHPQNLIHMLRKVTWIALISSVVFASMGYIVSYLYGFTHLESLIIGAAMMFSSTIIGLKLLPTRILHHQHVGEVMISVLLMQDLIAIVVMVILNGAGSNDDLLKEVILVSVGLPVLILFAYLFERYVLVKLFTRFEHSQEYVFLLSIGWCLGMAQLAQLFELSEHIGAFIAGVALAASPISVYIAESLKPLRDFFLVMFFFSIGAGFDFQYLSAMLLPTLILTSLILIGKPLLFYVLFRWLGEQKTVSSEAGFRLGQASEFSLLVGSIAVTNVLIGQGAAYLIQATTVLTFVVSSYIVVWRYPGRSKIIDA